MRRCEFLSVQFNKYDLSPSYVQMAVWGARRNKTPFLHVLPNTFSMHKPTQVIKKKKIET